MTRKQQEKYEKENGNTRELQCISMIDSVICYDGGYDNEYLTQYKKEFGEEKFKKMWDEQKRDIVWIHKNVFYDSEGCCYNSLVYVDEV